jgi:hypothetical protein
MKLPYPIQPARREIPFEDRDFIPLQFRHVLFAALGLPAVFWVASIIAQLIFSIPN